MVVAVVAGLLPLLMISPLVTGALVGAASLSGCAGATAPDPIHGRGSDMRVSSCLHCATDEGSACCGGLCVAVMGTDVKNCGGCGHACNPSETCVSGVCECAGAGPCPSGQACCGNAGGCRDLMSDAENCGACGTSCTSSTTATDSCTAGQCTCGAAPACMNGLLCCASSCIDVTSDPANCGACGIACNSGGTCMNGQCTGVVGGGCMTNADCPAGQTCDPTTGQCSGGGGGGCSPPCAAGQMCLLGLCTCSTDADCPAGGSCFLGVCF
jgi:Cys-rich repeat protein